MEKAQLRQQIKSRKSLLTDADKEKAAEQVFGQLESTDAFRTAENILLYYSLPDELPTHRFIERWAEKKKIYLPRVNGNDLDILPYSKTEMHSGAFNIGEPTGDETTPVDQMDIVVVPAVAYDRKGNRLGRGKGYYDRLLARAKVTKIGVGYDFQLVDGIDVEPHDVPVDIVITQTNSLVIRRECRFNNEVQKTSY